MTPDLLRNLGAPFEMPQYIYILVNPSLRGLLKIGKTTRTPDERAAELSASTNMPTPFMVAYEEEVPDCNVAEQLIHEQLAENGYRINDSREFFTVPLKTAIYTVSTVAVQLRDAFSANTESLVAPTATEDSSADYHFTAGTDAMFGTPQTLQDYGAARKHLETAISLGSIKAHFFLANLYIIGNGVTQSSEMALKILKAGGERGDPECYKTMWDIYAGNTVLDLRHEANAELCFQWYLKAAAEDVKSDAFNDYLCHAHDNLGGEGKYPIRMFPGKFAASSIRDWMTRVGVAFQKIKAARLAGIDIREVDSYPSPAEGSRMEIIGFELFVSMYVQDADSLMRSVMSEVTLADLTYCFSTAKDVRQTLAKYTGYLPANPRPAALPRPPVDAELPPQSRPTGFFRKFFSR